MTVDRVEQFSPTSSPWLEALLTHERTILPQASGMRTRALDRARALLQGGQAVPQPRSMWSGWHRTVFGSAAGFGLLTSAAVLHLTSAPSPSGTKASQFLAMPNTPFTTPPARVDVASPATPPGGEPESEWAEGETTTRVPSNEPGAVEHETRDRALDELGMLERARRFDARGQFLAVLAIAAEHERIHPAGHLCEERDVLRLRALIALKRGDEARQAVRKFHHDYPRSVLLPTLEEMLASAL